MHIIAAKQLLLEKLCKMNSLLMLCSYKEATLWQKLLKRDYHISGGTDNQ
jgi:hypothetical protein